MDIFDVGRKVKIIDSIGVVYHGVILDVIENKFVILQKNYKDGNKYKEFCNSAVKVKFERGAKWEEK